jgi:hypothetical protein
MIAVEDVALNSMKLAAGHKVRDMSLAVSGIVWKGGMVSTSGTEVALT